MSQSQSQTVSAGPFVVLTGDLVSSSKLAPEAVDEAVLALDRAAAEVAAAWGAGPARFTRFRGDGWQCLGPEAKFALRSALVLRARLSALGRSFDTRISFGIGTGRLDAAGGLDGAAGAAFELSGRSLDKMPHGQRFAISWETPPPEAALIRAVFALADEVSRNWTPGQARVFAAALAAPRRPSQEALAAELAVSQQTVAKQLSGGGDWALREALQALEGVS